MDFQTYGSGLVSIDFMHLLYFSQNIQSYDEVEELARGILYYITKITNDSISQFNILRSTLAYHQGLCENGVQDYGLEDFLMDIQLAICEKVIQLLATAKDSTPQKYQALLTKFFGEEKADDFLKIFERGCIVQPVLILTSLYVRDKDNFLLVK